MLGDFLKAFAENSVTPLTLQEVKGLVPGTAIVAVKDPSELSNGGLPTDIRFGIRAEEEDEIILQNPISDDWDKPYFQITAFDVDFLQMHFYLYGEKINTNPQATLQRAKERLYFDIEALRSKPGDDFVDECITGLSIEEIFAQYDPSSGQHWWTPLIVDSRFIIQQATSSLDSIISEMEKQGKPTVHIEVARLAISKLSTLKPVKLPEVEHHGILIERARLIHFSNWRIRTNSFMEFIETTANSAHGGAAGGKEEQIDVAGRLFTRNRAVWVFCTEGVKGRYWGTYSLFTNNCEHFSRACREKRRESCQVVKQGIEVIKALLNAAPLPFFGSLISQVVVLLINIWKPEDAHEGPIWKKYATFDELKRIFDNA